MESTSNNALVEEDIRLGGITNLFGHLELDHAENGQGRFDCVWCTISALIDMSPFDMQLCLPEEERPVTHRGIEQDGMKHRGLSDDEIKRLLIAVDKNIIWASRMEITGNTTRKDLTTIKSEWDRDKSLYGEGWILVDWQADPKAGKIIELPAGARIYLSFAFQEKDEAQKDEPLCEKYWVIQRTENQKEVVRKMYEIRDRTIRERRERLRKAFTEEKRKKAYPDIFK
ncbi:hypothetical protein FOQG_12519 [Fusarium oxysporum f. sp. raphani 54005]|uniref:Uncharacterized protein n=2 Tax=Fusarium oxysporum f. sp. raphani TaxID=96318 RepID=X0BW88_FUSOX|nr:hypothetical protein FOQG_12519 [Fusarium oxysporum f. sp. raphani 54005]KAG7425848.1 hypothetical protein Forpi1262_v013490 [Fusarium oxysporum f. sp. raphani]